ncbi:hypothetical protein D9758_008884 [Tetrapyrgos nigripes]|uniref:Piwi domain-containing protein n=1 Tax=Tetrapyrgos nigripes TaxID=182062 RepID=A0A8H5CP60_9AGAR|nr:hypothetical protein D9758_008884 [Tetrapyrgos nigripes]
MPPRNQKRPDAGATAATGSGLPAAHVTTIGVRRPGYGIGGKASLVQVNAFKTTIPDKIIYHYDIISPDEKVLPIRVNMDIIRALQHEVDPVTFTPPGVYDGRKNFFTARKLPFGEEGSKEFSLTLSKNGPQKSGSKGPKVYKVRLTHVATINPEVLQRFIAGKQSIDNAVLTSITALNVVIRMEPTMKYPFNVRSFFTNRETKDIGGGLELWRGYFQSVRPGVGSMYINIDISTGTMYKTGPLLSLCLEFLRKSNPNHLAPRNGLPDRERLNLQRFFSGLRITVEGRSMPFVLKKFSPQGAADCRFALPEGEMTNVGSAGSLIPLEFCNVIPGQIMRKQVPADKTKEVLDFATKKPVDRLASIRRGQEILAYGQSVYVREFGMNVERDNVTIQARILNSPKLKYGNKSRQPTVQPANGSWNMKDKMFHTPVKIERWVLVSYETTNRFNEKHAQQLVKDLVEGANAVGIVMNPTKVIKYLNGQGDIKAGLMEAGKTCIDVYKGVPTLIVVVLPEGGNDIYTAIKHFGDITMGVATQCLKFTKCSRAKAQYFANVCLKINVKLGGINLIPDPASVAVLTDPNNPTIVMGADVIHPAPGADGRPSFTALVASVDGHTAKYIAECSVQTSRQEMIEHLKPMAKNAMQMYMGYRQKVENKGPKEAPPKRIIFYRDGVSEGQFAQVLDQELSALKDACKELRITPKITVIVVGKRHHIRFFPTPNGQSDFTGNCPAGTVVDREIGHPNEFDFYLQSHGGLLGTSRPAHYSILYDENQFSVDALQSLSFALCHVYARSTRSVSIPAPVYYADIVCSRAKNHYDPQSGLALSDTATHLDSAQAETSLDNYRTNFKPLHGNQKTLMYFSVRVFSDAQLHP